MEFNVKNNEFDPNNKSAYTSDNESSKAGGITPQMEKFSFFKPRHNPEKLKREMDLLSQDNANLKKYKSPSLNLSTDKDVANMSLNQSRRSNLFRPSPLNNKNDDGNTSENPPQQRRSALFNSSALGMNSDNETSNSNTPMLQRFSIFKTRHDPEKIKRIMESLAHDEEMDKKYKSPSLSSSTGKNSAKKLNQSRRSIAIRPSPRNDKPNHLKPPSQNRAIPRRSGMFKPNNNQDSTEMNGMNSTNRRISNTHRPVIMKVNREERKERTAIRRSNVYKPPPDVEDEASLSSIIEDVKKTKRKSSLFPFLHTKKDENSPNQEGIIKRRSALLQPGLIDDADRKKLAAELFAQPRRSSSFRRSAVFEKNEETIKEETKEKEFQEEGPSPDGDGLRRSQRLLIKEQTKEIEAEKIGSNDKSLSSNKKIKEDKEETSDCRRELSFPKFARNTKEPVSSPLPNLRQIKKGGSMLKQDDSVFIKPSRPMPQNKSLLTFALANSAKKNTKKGIKRKEKLDLDSSVDSVEDFVNLENMVARPSFDFTSTLSKMTKHTQSPVRKKACVLPLSAKRASAVKQRPITRRSEVITLKSPLLNKIEMIRRSPRSLINWNINASSKKKKMSSVKKRKSVPRITIVSASSESGNENFEVTEMQEEKENDSESRKDSLVKDIVSIPKALVFKIAAQFNEAIENVQDEDKRNSLREKYNESVAEIKPYLYPKKSQEFSPNPKPETEKECKLSPTQVVKSLNWDECNIDSDGKEKKTDPLVPCNTSNMEVDTSHNTSAKSSSFHWNQLREDNKFLITPSVKKTRSILKELNKSPKETVPIVSPVRSPIKSPVRSPIPNKKLPTMTPRTKDMALFKCSIKKQLEELYD